MFNESKIFRSVEDRRQYLRKQLQLSKTKKRKVEELVRQMRSDERRPVYKRSKFKPHRYDVNRFNKMQKILGPEKAKNTYYYQQNRNSKQFWWEEHFDHSRYVTAFGRIVLDKAKRKAEEAIRKQFKNFLASVRDEDMKHLKKWVDHFGGMGYYHACFEEYEEESGSESDDDFLGPIEYEKVLPLRIQEKILEFSKSWESNRLPDTCSSEDTCQKVENESSVESSAESSEESEEEFTAGF